MRTGTRHLGVVSAGSQSCYGMSAKVHQPAAGPTKRTTTQNTTSAPMPTQAPRVVIAMNWLVCCLVRGSQLTTRSDEPLDVFGFLGGRPWLARRRASPMQGVSWLASSLRGITEATVFVAVPTVAGRSAPALPNCGSVPCHPESPNGRHCVAVVPRLAPVG